MKYTKFILRDDLFNYDVLKTNITILKPPFVMMTLVAGIVSILLVGGMLPMTVTIDGCRVVKYQFIMFTRKKHHNAIVRKTIVVYKLIGHNNSMIVHGFANVLKKIA